MPIVMNDISDLDNMEFGKIEELMCSEQISKKAALVSRSFNRPRTTYYRRAVSMCKCLP